MAKYWGFLGLWQENRLIYWLFFAKSIKTAGIRVLIAFICSILEKIEENQWLAEPLNHVLNTLDNAFPPSEAVIDS
jgi:hypothetical protein